MKIKKIRWKEPKTHQLTRPIEGYIGDKLIAIIMIAENDCAHLLKFYTGKNNRKDKSFRIHKNIKKAKEVVQELFEEFINESIEEL